MCILKFLNVVSSQSQYSQEDIDSFGHSGNYLHRIIVLLTMR
jgi:hypothetical protein